MRELYKTLSRIVFACENFYTNKEKTWHLETLENGYLAS